MDSVDGEAVLSRNCNVECGASCANKYYNTYNMKRTNFFFPEQMLDRLKAAKDKLGIPMSELIRRAIEDYLNKLGL